MLPNKHGYLTALQGPQLAAPDCRHGLGVLCGHRGQDGLQFSPITHTDSTIRIPRGSHHTESQNSIPAQCTFHFQHALPPWSLVLRGIRNRRHKRPRMQRHIFKPWFEACRAWKEVVIASLPPDLVPVLREDHDHDSSHSWHLPLHWWHKAYRKGTLAIAICSPLPLHLIRMRRTVGVLMVIVIGENAALLSLPRL